MTNIKKYKSKKFWISVANIIAGASAGLSILMFGGDPWLLTLAISAAAVSAYLGKSMSKKEREKQGEISLKALSAGILIPIGLILLILLTVVVIAVWRTYT